MNYFEKWRNENISEWHELEKKISAAFAYIDSLNPIKRKEKQSENNN